MFLQSLLLWKNITYCEFVSAALGAQHAMCMWHIVIYGLSSCTIFFSHYLINGTIFEKSYWAENVCFYFLYKFVWNISSSKKNSARYHHKCVEVFNVNYPLFFSDFYETWIFSTDFRNILKYQILWKSVQWELSRRIRTDGSTDRHEASRRFSQSCERA